MKLNFKKPHPVLSYQHFKLEIVSNLQILRYFA